MTKSKSQLRAEAVERLRDCRYHTLADYVRAMLGWGHEPHFEDSRDALIDLLTDEEPRKFGVTAEQMAKASADYFDKLPSVNGKKVDSPQDSRERLEAEIRYEYNGRIEWEADQIIGWLDRQAAITERHWMEICGANASANVELKRQIDALKANNAQLHALKLTAEQVGEAIKSNFVKVAVIDDGSDEVEWREGWVCNVGFDFQAITDELNAALGGGECDVVQGDNGPKCSNCGKELPEDPYSDYEGNFCPTCGARIRKAVKQ